MKFLTNTFTVIIEIIVLIISLIWFSKNQGNEEQLLAVIGACGVLLTSSITYIRSAKPKLEFHHINTHRGKYTRGLTPNNPHIIHVGVTPVESYYEIYWAFDLELRNNSSITAYNVVIDYLNKPKHTKIIGEIGKIQPILSNEKHDFEFKVSQFVQGTAHEADEYLNSLPETQLKNFKVLASYKNEYGSQYQSIYSWSEDETKFQISKRNNILPFVGVFVAASLIIGSLCLYFNYKPSKSYQKGQKQKEIVIPDSVPVKSEKGHSLSIKGVVKKPESAELTKPVKSKDTVKVSQQTSTINASGALIVTQGQSGGTNIVEQKIDAPIPEIKKVSSILNKKVDKIDNMDMSGSRIVFPSEKYPFKQAYKSTYTLSYYSKVPTNGFAFIIKRKDVLLSLVRAPMVYGADGKTKEGFLVRGVTRPNNGNYTLVLYTIDSIIDLRNDVLLQDFYECDRYELFERNAKNSFFTTTNRNRLYLEGLKWLYDNYSFDFNYTLSGIRVTGYKGNQKKTNAMFTQHITCEINVNARPIFLIDANWYKVNNDFIDTINRTCTEMITKNYLRDNIITLPWANTLTEGGYNLLYEPIPNFRVFDKVLSQNIELCDLYFEDDNAIYLIHVKDGFDAKIRDVSNQIVISSTRFWNDKNSGAFEFLDGIINSYNVLPINAARQIIRDEFINGFNQKEVFFVMAFNSTLGTHQDIRNDIQLLRSNIAKYSLIQCVRDMNTEMYPIKIFDIARL